MFLHFAWHVLEVTTDLPQIMCYLDGSILELSAQREKYRLLVLVGMEIHA
jgi:hypothetical protein